MILYLVACVLLLGYTVKYCQKMMKLAYIRGQHKHRKLDNDEHLRVSKYKINLFSQLVKLLFINLQFYNAPQRVWRQRQKIRIRKN